MKSLSWVKQSSDLAQNLPWGISLISFLRAVSLDGEGRDNLQGSPSCTKS